MPILTRLMLAAPLVLGLAGGSRADPFLSPIQRADISARLYSLGVADGDAIEVIAAAKLRKGMDFAPKDGAKTVDAAPLEWRAMLDTARQIAAGDDALLGVIDDVAADASKGVATGQVYSISQIGDGGTDTYDKLPFAGGDYAEVYVESRDGSDLNLYIFDAEGRLVCSDTDVSSISYCGWRPADSGDFTIEVQNKGVGAAAYALMTN